MTTPAPRKGYLFHPSECPNRNHPASMGPACGLCGVSTRAYRFGEHLAQVTLVAVLLGIVGVVLFLLTGCAPAESPAETRYLNAVHEVAGDEGIDWTYQFEAATLTFGEEVCASMREGSTEEAVRAVSTLPDPAQDAVVQASITAAIIYLCPPTPL